uniref:Neur_chan_LBD domain-containing protein n=1 Tax=Steinernema glaseri TaxID=37863 RepID=A0A1I7XWT5_9BILA
METIPLDISVVTAWQKQSVRSSFNVFPSPRQMMDLYFRRHNQWLHYYNCSFLSAEQWTARGQISVPMGVFSIASGTVYLVCLHFWA